MLLAKTLTDEFLFPAISVRESLFEINGRLPKPCGVHWQLARQLSKNGEKKPDFHARP
jgi:hypothetical protein